MAPLDVLRLGVQLGVVGNRDARLVVHGELGRDGVGVAELLLVPPEVDGLLPLAAFEPAINSASQEDSAMEVCFLEPQEIAALLSMETKPEVECLTAQSESVMPCSAVMPASWVRPRSLVRSR